jgi:hypothetical protein
MPLEIAEQELSESTVPVWDSMHQHNVSVIEFDVQSYHLRIGLPRPRKCDVGISVQLLVSGEFLGNPERLIKSR